MFPSNARHVKLIRPRRSNVWRWCYGWDCHGNYFGTVPNGLVPFLPPADSVPWHESLSYKCFLDTTHFDGATKIAYLKTIEAPQYRANLYRLEGVKRHIPLCHGFLEEAFHYYGPGDLWFLLQREGLLRPIGHTAGLSRINIKP